MNVTEIYMQFVLSIFFIKDFTFEHIVELVAKFEPSIGELFRPI